jgi:predicted dehydrogenase
METLDMSQLTRRRFLTTSAAGGSLLLMGTRASGAVRGANDRLRVAVAGLNGRGAAHVAGFLNEPDVEIAYLVDPDRNVLAAALQKLQERTEGKLTTKGVTDVREALDDEHVDVLSIATPNHWHSLMTIWGAQAGKHVYVEKPMSHDVAEGHIVVAAQRKYGVVIQHGTQNRSDAGKAGLHAAIHAGRFGKLKVSYGYCCKPRGGIGHQPVIAAPEHLDWNLWRGPARVANFHANLVHYNWHWFWETGNGDLNNQGTHELDIARWALDEDQTHPVRAMAIGGRFQWQDQGVTPNTMFGIAEYPNGQQVFFNVRNVNYEGYERQVENEYYFEDGSRIARGRLYAKGSETGEELVFPDGPVTPGGPFGSFVRAVRANDPSLVNASALDAHNSCVLGHVINNSYRLGSRVPFNKRAGRFGDDALAAEHFGRLHDIMAGGVGVPEDGNEYVVGPWLSFDPQTERFTGERADEANRLLKDANREGFEVPGVDAV